MFDTHSGEEVCAYSERIFANTSNVPETEQEYIQKHVTRKLKARKFVIWSAMATNETHCNSEATRCR